MFCGRAARVPQVDAIDASVDALGTASAALAGQLQSISARIDALRRLIEELHKVKDRDDHKDKPKEVPKGRK